MLYNIRLLIRGHGLAVWGGKGRGKGRGESTNTATTAAETTTQDNASTTNTRRRSRLYGCAHCNPMSTQDKRGCILTDAQLIQRLPDCIISFTITSGLPSM